jgi:hypothetical protein
MRFEASRGFLLQPRVVAVVAKEILEDGQRLGEEGPPFLFHARLVGESLLGDLGEHLVHRPQHLLDAGLRPVALPVQQDVIPGSARHPDRKRQVQGRQGRAAPHPLGQPLPRGYRPRQDRSP